MATESPLGEKPKRGQRWLVSSPHWWLMASIVGFIIFGGVCSFLSAFVGSILVEGRWFLAGPIEAYDPIISFGQVYDWVGRDWQFLSMDVEYVRSDGTLDLNAPYRPYVRYQFYKEVPNPNGMPLPLGAGGTGVAEPWYVVRTVWVEKPEMLNLAMRMRDASPSNRLDMANEGSPPTCHLSELWERAIETLEVPVNAVAIIRYDGERYYFNVRDTDFRMEFTTACNPVER